MKRSKHSLSHYRLLSCDMGKLVPVGCFDVLPGDTVQHATSLLLRVAPLVTPVMHPVTVRVHHWFVPYRLIWDNWEPFITGGPDGLNASVHPTKNTTVTAGSAPDYLGVPIAGTAITYNALPLRAYQLIYNEFYRDEDLVTAATVGTGDGVDSSTSVTLRDIMWEKDYLTSSRPWEQKGPTITIPLGSTAPVIGIAVEDLDPTSGGMPNARRSGQAEGTYAQYWNQDAAPTAGFDYFIKATGAGASAGPDIYADLSSASAITINALREAAALQRWEENRARGGSRYSEYLRVLGVRSSDARLQRPEYLGGGKQTIQFSEVMQTAEGTNPVGTLRGHGISALRSNRYRRFFEEHGVVISLLSVRPKTIYTNGQERMWNRVTKFDYFQKELQHIGSQAVLNKEAYALHATPNGTFGYQDRYDEYRRKESGVSGEFATSVLNSWHMARDFASAPALNSSFVMCNPTTRNFASATNDPLYVMARHSIQARRLVAKTGSARLS